MERPAVIRHYERVYLASFALSLVGWAVAWPSLSARFAADPRLVHIGWALPLSMALSAAVSLLLWYFTAKRASLAAKWIVVVLAGLGALRLLVNLPALLHGAIGGGAFLLSVVTAALSIWAAVLLFRPEAKAWFGEDMHGEVA